MLIINEHPQHVDLLRMPFDQYGRYKLLADAVEVFRTALAASNLRIIDVGGYQHDERFGERLPLQLFLPNDEVEALDTVASSLPHYHQGDGTAMPFEDGAFDLAVSADTLEHIPPTKRQQFVHEMLRVSRHGIVLVAPFFSHETELAERVLYQFMVTELRYHHPFLREHREYGLPQLAEVEQWCRDLEYATTTAPSGYVHTWLEMMLLRTLLWRLTRNDDAVVPLEEYYNRVLFPLERSKPAYRHAVIAAPSGQVIEQAQQTLASVGSQTSAEPLKHTQFLQQLITQLTPLGVLDRLRDEEETSLRHWQTTAQHWLGEAHRVEAERLRWESEALHWQQQTQRVDQERREVQADVQHWQAEAHRVELERQAWQGEAQHWQAEAHRVETERQELEARFQTAQMRWTDLVAQVTQMRDHWQRRAQRSLRDQFWEQIKRIKR